MKTKLTSVIYLGLTAVDRRFTNHMLPWLLKEINRTGTVQKLSLVIEDGNLKAFDSNFEPYLVHQLVDILRVSQVPGRPEQFFYILYNEADVLLNCYLYEANSVRDVSDLFSQMREPSPANSSPHGSRGSLASGGAVMRNIGFQTSAGSERPPWCSGPAMSLPHNARINLSTESPPLVRSNSNASALTSLSADLSPSDSHFFEVLYIGKVRISQRKVPETLIDDALAKFAQHEAEKARNNELRRHSLLSSTTSTSESPEKQTSDPNDAIKKAVTLTNTSTTPLEPDKTLKQTLTNQNEAEIEDEFDTFSKERVVKNGTTTVSKLNNVPLEPQVLVINNNKNNLTPLHEDEERNEDVKSDTKSDVSNPFVSKSNESSPTVDSSEKLNFNECDRKPKLLRSKTGLETSKLRGTIPENKPFLRDRSASIGTLSIKTPIAQLIGDQNRTMLFQVGRTELRLISPDRKQILLHRAFVDVSSCVVGRSCPDHFGFVCREGVSGTSSGVGGTASGVGGTVGEQFACYVFKCESDEVANETVNAIKQAFVSHAEAARKAREAGGAGAGAAGGAGGGAACELCPVVWYSRLCRDLEGMNEKRTHAFILRRIEQLPEDEQDQIITKYQGGTNHMYEVGEHNAFLMMLLRAHCESKQLRHVHDTAENRSEFLNQYLGGSTIFMKAKRSLSSGFDHLLKRKASRDDLQFNIGNVRKEPSPLPSPTVQVSSESLALQPPDVSRSKSVSPAVPVESPPSPASTSANPSIAEADEERQMPPSTSPMMDIFLKVGDSRPSVRKEGEKDDATWRQAIYNKVAHTETQEGELSTKTLLSLQDEAPSGKRSKEQLRQLWKMAIDQTILLVRMERENAKLKENEESSAVRRIKLEYTEMGPPVPAELWERAVAARRAGDAPARADHHMLTQAVVQGVPRIHRGHIWYFLAEQACLRSAPPDAKLFPNYNTPYRKLLAGLTKHQHAILIDLGRTFPSHEYFASALGPGQLALYNILKAYSLLDPAVGYCQGLSFVAGVLLLHMEEAEAFILLRHLMFRRGLRKQYLPDMSALQVQLYQLTRLLRDHEPELHEKLEQLDVSGALYAAPWMLTLFTSQFPLGFVVRVFDLIFLESTEVIFSVSLALLSLHKDGLMLCETCEEAAEYLKHKLPDIDSNMYERVMKKVITLDISRQLAEYAVEYSVLREEMPRLTTLTETNKKLEADNAKMSDELDSAMEALTNYQTNQSKMELQKRAMEQQLALLSRYISVTNKQELPTEIKKIVQTYNKKQSFGSKIFSKHTNENDENAKKNFKTGVSAPNLFAKINKDDILNAMNKERSKVSPETDRKHFLMKKSQSVHSGLIANPKPNTLKVVEENSEFERPNESYRRDSLILENLKELSKKTSGISNTQQINEERWFEKQLKFNFDENLKKIDDKLNQSSNSYIDDISIFQSRKSVSLNISNVNKSNDKNVKSNDSGFATPMTPNDDKKIDNVSIVSHPLSDCDVDIKLESTTLKQIRPIAKNH